MEIILPAGHVGFEAAVHPRADEQPENDRRRQRADDPVPLTQEAHELAMAKGKCRVHGWIGFTLTITGK